MHFAQKSNVSAQAQVSARKLVPRLDFGPIVINEQTSQ